MGFSAKQIRALKRRPDHRHVRTKEFHGRSLSYLEGWFTLSEANRIFGYDGWSRETVETRCIFARENHGSFLAIYAAKVRLTVVADGNNLIREGHGTAEARGDSLGQVHDIALKAAETDATKRALITFGAPFGLDLYQSAKPENSHRSAAHRTTEVGRSWASHPDDITPIPRPSSYYGRAPDQITEALRNERQQAVRALSRSHTQVPLAPVDDSSTGQKIDKSELLIGEPKRLRDKGHLRFVASKACLVCGRQPSDPHHLRFAQPRALGMKVSDEFTVPLCRTHHRQLHQIGDEKIWWQEHKIKPMDIARELWNESRPKTTPHTSSAS
jgi:hypothetical protein